MQCEFDTRTIPFRLEPSLAALALSWTSSTPLSAASLTTSSFSTTSNITWYSWFASHSSGGCWATHHPHIEGGTEAMPLPQSVVDVQQWRPPGWVPWRAFAIWFFTSTSRQRLNKLNTTKDSGRYHRCSKMESSQLGQSVWHRSPAYNTKIIHCVTLFNSLWHSTWQLWNCFCSADHWPE